VEIFYWLGITLMSYWFLRTDKWHILKFWESLSIYWSDWYNNHRILEQKLHLLIIWFLSSEQPWFVMNNIWHS
jgi:hypothetical protein